MRWPQQASWLTIARLGVGSVAEGGLGEHQRGQRCAADAVAVGTSFHRRYTAGQEAFMYLLENLCNYCAILGELCYDRNSSK